MAFKRSAVRFRLSPPLSAENVKSSLESFDSKELFIPNEFQTIAWKDALLLLYPVSQFVIEKRSDPKSAPAFGTRLERGRFFRLEPVQEAQKTAAFSCFYRKNLISMFFTNSALKISSFTQSQFTAYPYALYSFGAAPFL